MKKYIIAFAIIGVAALTGYNCQSSSSHDDPQPKTNTPATNITALSDTDWQVDSIAEYVRSNSDGRVGSRSVVNRPYVYQFHESKIVCTNTWSNTKDSAVIAINGANVSTDFFNSYDKSPATKSMQRFTVKKLTYQITTAGQAIFAYDSTYVDGPNTLIYTYRHYCSPVKGK